jgi:hypothetical protein
MMAGGLRRQGEAWEGRHLYPLYAPAIMLAPGPPVSPLLLHVVLLREEQVQG